MSIFYLDYENGDDVNDGSDWANAWKTIPLGATAARIAPGDIIRIAKSPAPVSIGNATWNNLSKTVTLVGAQNLNIDLCETAWTGAGDTTVTRTATTTQGKEGTYCMKLAVDASPQASILQAYFATGELDLSSYQKISFWIYNSGIISEDDWIVNLCSDVAGVDVVDSFLVPAIPSISRWLPLTLAKVGGGNLGASIKSIAIYSGTGIPLASKYIYVDDFIACTTNGLNLQSLISKNSLEQGGAESWYGIQSINGTTILLDNGPQTNRNYGNGYYGTTETVTTYKRETIKTPLATTSITQVQAIKDSGTSGNNIEFQGGYNIATTIQEGETFFDGLNGYGYGIYLVTKSYITLNRINVVRYNHGIGILSGSSWGTIDNLLACNNQGTGLFINASYKGNIINLSSVNNYKGVDFADADNWNVTAFVNINNNYQGGISIDGNNNLITLISNVNNNGAKAGIYLASAKNNRIVTISNVNNNGENGIYFYDNSFNNIFNAISNINNNTGYGIKFRYNSFDNKINSLSTAGNSQGGIYHNRGINHISNASIAEGTEFVGVQQYYNARVCSTNHDQGTNHRIYTDDGQIDSEATDRIGGTGIMWKLAILGNDRIINYPLILSVAKIAVVADKLVTIKIWMKKSHATNVGGKLVCPGGQLPGMSATDIVDTKADDADTWEELEVTFTPTKVGVVEIEAWAYYLVANGDVYVEDMTITQAD